MLLKEQLAPSETLFEKVSKLYDRMPVDPKITPLGILPSQEKSVYAYTKTVVLGDGTEVSIEQQDDVNALLVKMGNVEYTIQPDGVHSLRRVKPEFITRTGNQRREPFGQDGFIVVIRKENQRKAGEILTKWLQDSINGDKLAESPISLAVVSPNGKI